MNILILVGTLTRGGAEKQAILDAGILSANNKVILVTYRDGPLRELANENVEVIVMNHRNYPSKIRGLIKLINKNNIEIIHAYLMGPLIQNGIAGTLTKTKVIWHIHSHLYSLNYVSKYLLKFLAHSPAVKLITYVNKELREYFENKFKFPPSKGTILYNASNLKVSEKTTTGKVIIGFAGRLIPLKRLEYLIEMAHNLHSSGTRGFEIWIIGDGTHKEDLEKQAKKLNVDQIVKFKGFHIDIVPFYETFDIFILPSREECLSLALIDAGMAGIPSIAFDVGGNNEIIIDGKTGFVVNTKQELIEKTKILMASKEKRKLMGSKAKSHCEKRFSPESHSFEFKKLYNKL